MTTAWDCNSSPVFLRQSLPVNASSVLHSIWWSWLMIIGKLWYQQMISSCPNNWQDLLSPQMQKLCQWQWTHPNHKSLCPSESNGNIWFSNVRPKKGGVKVILKLSNKNSDHCSHIQEIQLERFQAKVVFTTSKTYALCAVSRRAACASESRLPLEAICKNDRPRNLRIFPQCFNLCSNSLNYWGNRSSVCGLFSNPTSNLGYGKCRECTADHHNIAIRCTTEM